MTAGPQYGTGNANGGPNLPGRMFFDIWGLPFGELHVAQIFAQLDHGIGTINAGCCLTRQQYHEK
jgi:hypothetical protein